MAGNWYSSFMCRFKAARGQEWAFARLPNVSTSPVSPWTCVVLYGAGIAFWLNSFWFANLTGLDWRLTLAYQSILKDALQTGQIPYITTLMHYTHNFLGTPETPLSPQFLLLPWLDAWSFNVLNLCFLYSLSFIGLLLIKRRYALSWIPFTLMWLLFNFSGCIVSRVAVGHTMWYGYFLLPFFYLCVFDILEERNVKRTVYLLAGILFLMELQGSFHLLVWCCMFLGLTVCFAPHHFKPIATAVVWTIALCTFRIAPTVVTLQGTTLLYVNYFPTPGMLLDGLCVLSDPFSRYADRIYYWHELDCYVGFAGLTLLVVFGWLYPYGHPETRITKHWALYPALLVMVVLSLGPVWHYVYLTGIPLLGSQRVPARFIVLSVTASIFLAVPRMQRYLEDAKTPKGMKWLLGLALIPVARELLAHASLWTVRNIETVAWEKITTFLPVSLVAPDMSEPSVRLYLHTLWTSTAFSLTVALFWAYRLYKARLGGDPLPPSRHISTNSGAHSK